MLELTVIDNVFEAKRRRILVDRVAIPATAGELVERELAPPHPGSHAIIIDGARATPDTPIPADARQVIAARLPATEAIISLIVYAVISAAVGAGLNLLINLLLGPPKRPNRRDNDSAEGSAAYNWDGIVNTITQGSPIPVGYGEHRIGGQIIQLYRRNGTESNTKNYLYMVLCLGHGQLREIGQYTQDMDHLLSNQHFGDAFDDEGVFLEDEDEWTQLYGAAQVVVQTSGELTTFAGGNAGYYITDLDLHPRAADRCRGGCRSRWRP